MIYKKNNDGNITLVHKGQYLKDASKKLYIQYIEGEKRDRLVRECVEPMLHRDRSY